MCCLSVSIHDTLCTDGAAVSYRHHAMYTSGRVSNANNYIYGDQRRPPPSAPLFRSTGPALLFVAGLSNTTSRFPAPQIQEFTHDVPAPLTGPSGLQVARIAWASLFGA